MARGVVVAQREVGSARRLPRLRLGTQRVRAERAVDHHLDREAVDRAAVHGEPLVDLRELGPRERPPHRDNEAVAETSGSVEHGGHAAAEPDLRGRRRERVYADPLEVVVSALERHAPRPAEQLTEHRDLLLEPGGPLAPGHAERPVLDPVPAGADPHPEPVPGKELELRRLLGDERCLPLGQDEDRRRQADSIRRRGQEGERDERLVERVVLGVERRQSRVAIGVLGPEHVVERLDPRVAEVLGCLGEVAQDDRVVADPVARDHRAELERRQEPPPPLLLTMPLSPSST